MRLLRREDVQYIMKIRGKVRGSRPESAGMLPCYNTRLSRGEAIIRRPERKSSW